MPRQPLQNKGAGSRPQDKRPVAGTNYLLAIGVDRYEYLPRLYNCVKDARDMVAELTDRYQFEKENITTLFDAEATRTNIYRAFRRVAQKVNSNDNFLIYFSGHGEYDQIFEQGYWIPVEAGQDAHDQYIPNSEIRAFLSAVKSRHTFLMADSCFSGALFAKGVAKEVSKRYESDPSRWGLTSGRNEIVSDGQPGDNSPFAESLLYRLRQNTGALPVQELCAHVVEYVAAKTNQTPIGEPIKVKGHKSGQFVFHLKKDEGRDWAAALKQANLAAFQTFLAAYPSGQYAEEAAWRIAQLKNTVNAYLQYRFDFPDGRYREEALQCMRGLEDDKDWRRAQRYPTAFAFAEYLDKHPQGKHAVEGQEALRQIQRLQDEDDFWTQTQQQHNMDAYQAYLENYPKGKYRLEANNRLRELEEEALRRQAAAREKRDWEEAKRLNNLSAYQHFLSQYAEGSYASEARQAQKELEKTAWEAKEARRRAEAERREWEKAQKRDTATAYRAYLQAHPQGAFAEEAKTKIKALKPKPNYTEALKKIGIPLGVLILAIIVWQIVDQGGNNDPFQMPPVDIENALTPNSSENTNATAADLPFKVPEMIAVTGDTFEMGCKNGRDENCQNDEKPLHTVRIENFSIGKYEITNEEFCFFLNEEGNKEEGGATWLEIESDRCMIEKRNDKFYPKSGKETHPVVEVSWYGAVAYCKWLSQKTGGDYRLPSEAEWEFAARGGKDSRNYLYAGGNDLELVAWYGSNAGGASRPVGKKAENELRLHDMSGNAWEWCRDCWNGDYKGAPEDGSAWEKGNCSARVLRGGSWNFNNTTFLRCATRLRGDAYSRVNLVGLRVAQD